MDEIEQDQRPVHWVYLSLGSNIEPEEKMVQAVRMLSRFGDVSKISSVWETAPLGNRQQPNYLNAVVLLKTTLTPLELKKTALAFIENALGRIRSDDKYAPRTIDIDILLYDHDILAIGKNQIPNPEIYERDFVAIPLAEIAPDLVHPSTGEKIYRIAERFRSKAPSMRLRDDIQLMELNNESDQL